MKIFKHSRFSIGMAACFFVQMGIAQDFCIASVIGALKTRYSHVESGSYSQAVYEATCTKADSNNDFVLGLNVPDMEKLSFSSSGRSI